jgi:hypothetical protein
MKLKILRNIPKTIRLSWLRAARGRTKVARAEESVRITVISPAEKTRIRTATSVVDISKII